MKIKVKSTVQLKKAHSTDAGWDIVASESKTIRHLAVGVSTGIYMEIPHGWCAVIKERSGKALNHNLRVHGGVIDADYRNEFKVIMSSAQGSQLVSKGDKIAQLLFLPVPEVDWEIVDEVDDATERGLGGFGSSDVPAV